MANVFLMVNNLKIGKMIVFLVTIDMVACIQELRVLVSWLCSLAADCLCYIMYHHDSRDFPAIRGVFDSRYRLKELSINSDCAFLLGKFVPPCTG